jgi:ribonuclease P protein component
VASKSRILRLKSSNDFTKLKTARKIVSSRVWLILSFQKNDGKGFRVGWTLPSYVGTAVVRNRLKRWMREFLIQNQGSINKVDMDINIVLRRKGADFYKQLERKELDVVLSEVFQTLRNKT